MVENQLPKFQQIGMAPPYQISIGGGVMTSYRFFKMAAIESAMYFRVQV